MITANSQYRLYLSNLRRNQIEVLNLADSTFSNTPIRVGAQPWALHRPSQDTLFVANSGGTNIRWSSSARPRRSSRASGS